MNLGFVRHRYDEKCVEMARDIGFDCIEFFVDYENGALDIDTLTDKDIEKVMNKLSECGITVGTACCSINLLDADLKKREKNIAYMRKMIENVGKFGTNIISTNLWGNSEIHPAQNIPLFKEIYSPIAELCEKHGVLIAFENCPHYGGFPAKVYNLMYTPEMWGVFFDTVPSKALGLEFDPSHLVWLGIDEVSALKGFVERVYAFHAKDTEIFTDKLNQYGTLGRQIGKPPEYAPSRGPGWWRYRIPGWGQVKWRELFKIFYDAKYTGPVIIEHEDPVFDGELHVQGLKMGHDFLRQFDVPKI